MTTIEEQAEDYSQSKMINSSNNGFRNNAKQSFEDGMRAAVQQNVEDVEYQKKLALEWRTNYDACKKGYHELIAKADKMAKTLETMINPIGHLQNEAREKGFELVGSIALSLVSKSHFYQELAQKALDEYNKENA